MGFRTERLKAKKSVAEVMAYLGVSDAAVYFWENGNTLPKADNLIKLAKFYGCSTDALLTDNPIQKTVQ